MSAIALSSTLPKWLYFCFEERGTLRQCSVSSAIDALGLFDVTAFKDAKMMFEIFFGMLNHTRFAASPCDSFGPNMFTRFGFTCSCLHTNTITDRMSSFFLRKM